MFFLIFGRGVEAAERSAERERESQHTNFIITVCTKRGIVGDDDDDDEWKNE